MNTINNCLIEKKSIFGTTKYENHAWVYLDKEHRECLDCGTKEIYFGHYYNGLEDWRPLK